jgi:hypothetical protein
MSCTIGSSTSTAMFPGPAATSVPVSRPAPVVPVSTHTGALDVMA